MITMTELREYSKLLGLNLGQTEKNYFHISFLFALSRMDTGLVFKGGTCLMICYNLDRFSEDLDFTATKEVEVEDLLEKVRLFLKKYSINMSFKALHDTKVSKTYKLYFEGPLYDGTNRSLSSVELDVSLRDDAYSYGLRKINHVFDEFPVFHLNVLDKEEIFAEKIRAVMTRDKARDVYDLYYLVGQNIKTTMDLVNKKLSFYNLSFDFGSFKKAVERKRGIWEKELKNVVKIVPDFELVKEEVVERVERMD